MEFQWLSLISRRRFLKTGFIFITRGLSKLNRKCASKNIALQCERPRSGCDVIKQGLRLTEQFVSDINGSV